MDVLVTGGGGFLGRAIVHKLLARGDRVRILNRSDHPDLEALGVITYCGDIADEGVVMAAAKGADAVIHVAAKAGSSLHRSAFERANIQGTDRVLEACQRWAIPRLVYTSSPSVVHAGDDIEGGDESLPYPAHFLAPYPETKAHAEQRVLSAHGASFATVALRPHLIWGPGDNQLLPRLIHKNRTTGIRLPRPEKLIDTVYIDNAAEAHLLALDALKSGTSVGGQAFFISNDEPIAVGEMITRLLEAVGERPRIRIIPLAVAKPLAMVIEAGWRGCRRHDEPPLSRFVLEQLATAHWFDLTAAKTQLGYRPAISLDQGLARLRERHQESTRSISDRLR